MGLFCIACAFWPWFLRASLVLFEFRQVHFSGQLLQCSRVCLRAHLLKDDPVLFGYRDHHAVIGALHMPGQVVAGDLIGNLMLTVDAAQGGFDDGQDIVGDQRHAEAEECGFGVA